MAGKKKNPRPGSRGSDAKAPKAGGKTKKTKKTKKFKSGNFRRADGTSASGGTRGRSDLVPTKKKKAKAKTIKLANKGPKANRKPVIPGGKKKSEKAKREHAKRKKTRGKRPRLTK